ncbi:MAG: leucine--tRNA ligase [Thermoleophilia bacterium]|nr:leucine--tRNA ligase [Thermoleophilia bacterium]
MTSPPSESPERYDPAATEARWQAVWTAERAFRAEPVGRDGGSAVIPNVPKSYVLEMLPYPSGEIHMGHVKNYTMGDVVAHFRRRTGHVVFHPMGYDAFGLPAENAAIRTGEPPAEVTARNIASIRTQLQRLGFSIDWETEISTADPEYYRWTQWIFLRFLEAGLAERREAAVNWCPTDQTVLANEQVVDGRCERCSAPVELRQLPQWFLRITDYAQALLDDMDLLEDWPERVLTMQRNWIGRAVGARVRFRLDDDETVIPVFTTRPDTLYGATFFLMAPEHPLVPRLVEGRPEQPAVTAYVGTAARMAVAERSGAERPKTGVFTGRYVTNPVTGVPIPVWVADYVLMDYGTGAIMAVPGHDERDFTFARAHDLPVVRVIAEDGVGADAPLDAAMTGPGRMVNSDALDGMEAPAAGEHVCAWLAERDLGEATVGYRLRDWLISRQRYWGAPIPVVNCAECGVVPVPDDQLPVLLPHVDDYAPRGRSPLAAATDWLTTTCPSCGGPATRETDTMDTFVDSSWYFLRYTAPHYSKGPFSREIADYWLPVDQYIGGVEHAILHLLYARFVTKVLNDLDLVSTREPFARLFTQGMIHHQGAKMSKSRGNVVPPDEIVQRFGADTLRLYILFMGPAADDAEWSDTGVEGQHRFLGRIWRLVHGLPEGIGEGCPTHAEVVDDPAALALMRKAAATVAKVTQDIGERFSFHTAISAVQELVNHATRDVSEGTLESAAGGRALRHAARTTVSLIFPFAPHIASDLWATMGGERLWVEPWPEVDPAFLTADTVTVVVQINGKVRDTVNVAPGMTDDALAQIAMALPKVQAALGGAEPRRTIVVPGKLVNLVVGGT